MIRNLNQLETKLGPTPLLEALREELEGLSKAKTVIARKVSARARVRNIRNAHVAQCSVVFFRRNFFGFIEANPNAGVRLIRRMYGIK